MTLFVVMQMTGRIGWAEKFAAASAAQAAGREINDFGQNGVGRLSGHKVLFDTCRRSRRILVAMKRVLWLAMVFALSFTAVLVAQNATPGRDSCPDEIDSTDKYVNYSYGFSIQIPANLKGVWNSARCVSKSDGCVCMSDHGRIIPLAATPDDRDHFIEAYAGFPAHLDAPTVRGLVADHLDWVQERSRPGSVSILQRADVTIGGLKGKRVIVHYYDRESKRVMVEDFVQLLRVVRGMDVEYSLYLRTPQDAYEREKPLFDAVLGTFSLGDCDNC